MLIARLVYVDWHRFRRRKVADVECRGRRAASGRGGVSELRVRRGSVSGRGGKLFFVGVTSVLIRRLSVSLCPGLLFLSLLLLFGFLLLVLRCCVGFPGFIFVLCLLPGGFCSELFLLAQGSD